MVDRTGVKVGRLTFKSPTKDRTRDGTLKWVLVCDCGKEVVCNPSKVMHGHVKSCGCLHRDKTVERLICRNTSHGHAERGRVSITYRAWQYIFDRLKNDPDYADVKVCERWLKFENFLADMGERPEGLSLDRIDNNKGYEPGNCRWATMLQQQNNRTNNVRLSHGGRDQTLSEWSRELGVSYEPMRRKYHRLGKPHDFIQMLLDKLS